MRLATPGQLTAYQLAALQTHNKRGSRNPPPWQDLAEKALMAEERYYSEVARGGSQFASLSRLAAEASVAAQEAYALEVGANGRTWREAIGK
jgi:hypothetical protein